LPALFCTHWLLLLLHAAAAWATHHWAFDHSQPNGLPTHQLCLPACLPASCPQVVEINGQRILLAAVDGDVKAVSNKCSHLGLPLVGKTAVFQADISDGWVGGWVRSASRRLMHTAYSHCRRANSGPPLTAQPYCLPHPLLALPPARSPAISTHACSHLAFCSCVTCPAHGTKFDMTSGQPVGDWCPKMPSLPLVRLPACPHRPAGLQ
jgi:nitrite reductase/ring-hydroxylating ferredoxin subunit